MKSISEYQQEYDDLIFRVKTEDRKKLNRNHVNYVYYEAHHILPKCVYPEYASFKQYPWNRVLLTPEEHFDVHQLLALIYPNNSGLSMTAVTMSGKYTITRKEFGEIKRKFSKMLVESMTGRIVPEQVGLSISIAKKGKSNGRNGSKHSEETIQKLKKPKPPRTKQHSNNISKANKGRIPWNKGIKGLKRISRRKSNILP